MAVNQTIKLWHFDLENAYLDALNQVPSIINEQDICFIKDKAYITTNGQIYNSFVVEDFLNSVFENINEGDLINIEKEIDSISGLIKSITINVINHTHTINEIEGLTEELLNKEPIIEYNGDSNYYYAGDGS